jgi:hypothetical protein
MNTDGLAARDLAVGDSMYLESVLICRSSQFSTSTITPRRDRNERFDASRHPSVFICTTDVRNLALSARKYRPLSLQGVSIFSETRLRQAQPERSDIHMERIFPLTLSSSKGIFAFFDSLSRECRFLKQRAKRLQIPLLAQLAGEDQRGGFRKGNSALRRCGARPSSKSNPSPGAPLRVASPSPRECARRGDSEASHS